MANHPEGTVKGNRIWPIQENLDSLLIEFDDFDSNSKLRLKDFADISLIKNEGIIESLERTDKRRIIHWLLESISCKAILHIPDGNEVVSYEGLIENYNLEEGNIYQLEREDLLK